MMLENSIKEMRKMKINDYRIIVRTKQVEYLYTDTDYKLQWKKNIKAVMLNKEFSTKNEAVEYLQNKGWELDAGSTRRLINSNRQYEALAVPYMPYPATWNQLVTAKILSHDRLSKEFYSDLYRTLEEQKEEF